MATFLDQTGHRTFTSGSTLARYLRVKTPAGVVVAGAEDRELGINTVAVNTSGDLVDVLLRTAQGTVPMTANGAITAGNKVYGAASGKVSGTANGNPIGYALTAATADGDIIEVERIAEAAQLAYSNVAASAAHSNTTTEALFDKQYSIPANTLKAGDVIKVRYQGIATATNSTDTLAIKLYLGGLSGTALLTGTATDVANSDIFAGEAMIVVRTVGATGTFVAVGTHTDVPAASGTAVHDITEITASTTLDTTAAQVIGVGADWSVANAGNSARLDIFVVEHIKA